MLTYFVRNINVIIKTLNQVFRGFKKFTTIITYSKKISSFAIHFTGSLVAPPTAGNWMYCVTPIVNACLLLCAGTRSTFSVLYLKRIKVKKTFGSTCLLTLLILCLSEPCESSCGFHSDSSRHAGSG